MGYREEKRDETSRQEIFDLVHIGNAGVVGGMEPVGLTSVVGDASQSRCYNTKQRLRRNTNKGENLLHYAKLKELAQHNLI